MIVLGVNGSPDGGHDASACIVQDGRVIAVGEEERFSRRKHAYDVYPHAAIIWCLQSTGISLADVDVVCFSWDLPTLYAARGRSWQLRGHRFQDELFPSQIFPNISRPPIKFIPHHLSHAASCLWTSGFEDASILVVDGQGEGPSATIAYGHRQRGIEVIAQIGGLSSLGYLYKAASGYLGLGRENPGKTMGLASYGTADPSFGGVRLSPLGYSFDHLFEEISPNTNDLDDMETAVAHWNDYFCECGWPRFTSMQRWDRAKGRWEFNHPSALSCADHAASVQLLVEKVILHLAREAVRETGCPRLVVAGGVGLNCSANGHLAQAGFEDLFVFPAAGDSGTSVGAALYESHLRGNCPEAKRWTECFLGPEYGREEIETLLNEFGIKRRVLEIDAILEAIADALAADKIVAVFRGRSEIGPRALGQRSILASPHSAALRDRVNRVKGRESWRPLGPSVLEAEAGAFFLRPDLGSHFMMRSLRVRPEVRTRIEGAVHIDGTARAQLVREDTDFGRVISAFHRRTGLPLVLNTSFNLAGEPIVGSPRDALCSFLCSGIDVMVLGDALVEKETNPELVERAP